MSTVTTQTVRELADHIPRQDHAMAGATIASSAALACSLGEVCVRLNISQAEPEWAREKLTHSSQRLRDIRLALLDRADEDGAAIAKFAALRSAGKTLQGQEYLCQLPVEMADLAIEAALLMQDVRLLMCSQEDDLEMAIRLLDAAARAATLLLDSNLRIWPEPALLETFEPKLAELRTRLEALKPVASVR
ncbi:MAG: hypothetical protein GXP42_13795 [Chloroflexi bacterium]|nr:hypothetical protein [Chloroflexota bacterium]